ncbi:hypothetical protein Acsp01_84650 [Actinoplanes sp. NBRC 101535]|nr:hypothetical protein Acsp01_84650 [Actinoplanes sp. NBRC 101535]
MLHTTAALILVAAVVWWIRAAPRPATDARVAEWRGSAEQLLPDTGRQEMAASVALAAGTSHEEVADVGGGDFTVSVVCAGAEGSRVRVSLAENESGRGLACSGDRTPEMFSLGLADELHLRIAVDDAGPVIFRYKLERSLG